MSLETISTYDISLSDDVCLARELKAGSSPLYFESKTKYIKECLRSLYIKIGILGLDNNLVKIPDMPTCVIITTGGNLGGTIISIPLIEAARRRWPFAHLAIITNSHQSAEIIDFMKLGDSCYVSPNTTVLKGFFSKKLRRLKKTLGQLKPEILIDNHDFFMAHLLVFLRVPIRIGHVGYSVSGEYLSWGNLYNKKVFSTVGENWLDSYSHLSKAFSLDHVLPKYPTIKITDEIRSQAKSLLIKEGLGVGQQAIAIQAGVWSHEQYKQWPLELLAKTCSRLWKENNLVPVILGVAGQEDCFLIIKSAMPSDAPVINLVGKTTPSQAVGILSACIATIANDSGLMHLSAAVGTRTVAIYGMTNSEITWCYGSKAPHRIVRRLDILPCNTLQLNLMNKCHSRLCLSHISDDIVVKAVQSIIYC